MKFVLRRPVPPLWLLGLLTFSGPVGMHIFVPALPAAAKDLHATPVAMEMTLVSTFSDWPSVSCFTGPPRIASAAGRRFLSAFRYS